MHALMTLRLLRTHGYSGVKRGVAGCKIVLGRIVVFLAQHTLEMSSKGFAEFNSMDVAMIHGFDRHFSYYGNIQLHRKSKSILYPKQRSISIHGFS